MRITLYMKQFRWPCTVTNDFKVFSRAAKRDLKISKVTTTESGELTPYLWEIMESRINIYSIFIRLTHSFFNPDMAAKKHKVLWEDSGLPFDEVPFVVVNHKVYDCQHGVDRHLSEKKRNQAVGFY